MISTIGSPVGTLTPLVIGVSFGIFFSVVLSHFEYYEGIKKKYDNWLFDSECNVKDHNMSPLKVLMGKQRILCLIVTGPENHESRAQYVRDTWGKRCDKLIFMSSQNDSSLPAVGLDVDEGRDNLWAKTKEALKYVYKHHYNDYDWVLKTDDDTFVVMENLRLYLSKENPLDSKWYGYLYRTFVKQGYMSGAAYVFSKEVIQRLIEDGISNPDICRQDDGGYEDVEIGLCLEKLGAPSADTRDIFGRIRFLPMSLNFHLEPQVLPYGHWYNNYQYYPSEFGTGCCSKFAISFHYVDGEVFHLYEYILYKLRLYGVYFG